MYLESLEITNYRSLEYVKLDHLQKFNVLIGRNNAGKSSVFNVLYHVARTATSGQRGGSDNILTAFDNKRRLEVSLIFELKAQERKACIETLIASGHSRERFDALLDSPFLRHISFLFKALPGNPFFLYLCKTQIRAEDGKWATIQRSVGDPQNTNFPCNTLNICGVGSLPAMKEGPLDFGRLDIDAVNQNRLHGGLQSMVQSFTLTPEYPRQVEATRDVPKDSITILLHNFFVQYFSNAFFFNPFRHSSERQNVQQTPTLAQDGNNLAQVLHTINSNDRLKFQDIEQFVHAALPDIGQLQTPLAHTNTEVAFRSRYGNYLTRLHDMGGGIEQLLMVATVLLTTGDENTMFVEEPESHLHAGAQRFLLEKLYEGERQVFITTHSPTYINFSHPHSIYRVSHVDERTHIEQCNDKPDLVLEDIGVRNSDLLLSDAVVFVEGPSDRDVLTTLSETLGTSFAERNVTPLIMGGGQYAERGTPIRSDVLAGISQKAPIPHLFLLDRDERSQAEISNLTKRLANYVHILAARELENYLLVPRALLTALRTKHQNDAQMLEKLDQSSEEQIKMRLHDIADSLYDMVLLKRIRSEIGGLKDGLLPRQSLANLDTQNPELDKLILNEIKEQTSQRLANIGDIVQFQRETLATAWADHSQHLVIAPGEEIIAILFKHFGSHYNKTTDAVRIAGEMRKDEIAPELQEVIKKVLTLVQTYR